MVKVSNEELSKIAQFVASCNDMINGKFILADVKITKILNMIAGSDELYRYITECMTGFDFLREFHKAEVKNGLNNGTFSVPSEREKIVAFVFCLLVECDAKRIDFYGFITENFTGSDRSDSYKNFASKLLVPFRDIVSSHFGLNEVSQTELNNMTEIFRQDLNAQPIFENEKNKTVIEPNLQQNFVPTQTQNVIATPNIIQNNTAPSDDDKIWNEILEICDNIESSIYTEKHLKNYLKDELLYVIKTIKYSTKYRDIKILSALITAFDEMSKKCRSTQFVFGELKEKMQQFYK